MSDIKVKMVQWFDNHYYKVCLEDGQVIYIPSVTTKLGAIAKPMLIKWYGDLGTREANLQKMEAAERGSRIHYAWQVFTTDGLVIYNPYEYPLFTNQQINDFNNQYNGNIAIIHTQDEMWNVYKLQKWVEVVNPEIYYSEVIVYSLLNFDAGTMDNLMLIPEGEYNINGSKPLYLPGGIYVVDLKTGNYVGNEAKMQVSAYAKCVEEMGMAEVAGALILHTSSKNRGGIEGLATIYLGKEDIEHYYTDYRIVSNLWERQFGNLKPMVRELPNLISRKEVQNGNKSTDEGLGVQESEVCEVGTGGNDNSDSQGGQTSN